MIKSDMIILFIIAVSIVCLSVYTYELFHDKDVLKYNFYLTFNCDELKSKLTTETELNKNLYFPEHDIILEKVIKDKCTVIHDGAVTITNNGTDLIFNLEK